LPDFTIWRCGLSTDDMSPLTQPGQPGPHRDTDHAATTAILRRLWLALTREPLPGITTTHHAGGTTVHTHHGTAITGDTPTDFTDHQPPRLRVGDTPITEPRHLLQHLPPDTPGLSELADHLDESARNLALATESATPHPAATDLWRHSRTHHPHPGVYFEQIVVAGHPIHPMNRTRGGLTPHQVRSFAPEHQPRLAMILARPHAPIRHTGAWPWRDNDGTPLLPMHPFQADRLADHLDIRGSQSVAPLMSLRTLAPVATPNHHVKTAVDLQMTSAVRRVSAAALHNGPQLGRIVADLTPRTGMAVHTEDATITVLDDTGHPRADMSAILRTLPTGDAVPVPLAALTEPDPATGTPLIATIIATTKLTPHQWWTRFVPTLLKGPLTLSSIGISLEAHGQNTLIELDDGQPHRLVYRDFGGVRVDTHQLAATGIDCPPLHGDIPQPEPQARHTTLIAALYATVLRHLVHTLTHHYQTPPDTWWHPVVEHSHRLSHPDPHLHTMIFADTWPLKATTAMRLSPNPLTNQWIHLPNPIAGRR